MWEAILSLLAGFAIGFMAGGRHVLKEVRRPLEQVAEHLGVRVDDSESAVRLAERIERHWSHPSKPKDVDLY